MQVEMRFWLPFDSDPVEEGLVRRPYTNKIPNEGISLHMPYFGIDYGRREVEPWSFREFSNASMIFSCFDFLDLFWRRIDAFRVFRLWCIFVHCTATKKLFS